LQDTVDIVTCHTQLCLFLFFVDAELIPVVLVQAVTGGNPYKTISVKVGLADETTGQLFVSVKQFTCLGIDAQRQKKKQECKNFTFHVSLHSYDL
jgi:hypothetical protein